jgi:uncharacterized damage-inducible protein DinB
VRLELIRRLYAHLEWADQAALRALQGAPGSLEKRALGLYAHVLGAEHVWLARLEQRRPSVAVWPDIPLAECATLSRENAAAFHAFLAALTETGLDEQIPYINSAGQHFRSTVLDILVHVSLHGTYHRGQVALLVRDGGGKPAPTDFIAFVRGAPAATRVGP